MSEIIPAHKRSAYVPMLKRPRLEIPAFLAWVRSFPCIICGDNTSTEAAHYRSNDARFFKFNPGKHKPDDLWVLPLCGAHHQHGEDAQHKHDEDKWWKDHGIDAPVTCLALYTLAWLRGRDVQAATCILENARRAF